MKNDKYKVKVNPWWPFIRVNQTDDVWKAPRGLCSLRYKPGCDPKRKKEGK